MCYKCEVDKNCHGAGIGLLCSVLIVCVVCQRKYCNLLHGKGESKGTNFSHIHHIWSQYINHLHQFCHMQFCLGHKLSQQCNILRQSQTHPDKQYTGKNKHKKI